MSDDTKLNIPDRVPVAEQLQQIAADQAGMSREDIKQQMIESSETVFDPETAPKIAHKWVDRGLVLSCEGAGHPNHRHFKYKP